MHATYLGVNILTSTSLKYKIFEIFVLFFKGKTKPIIWFWFLTVCVTSDFGFFRWRSIYHWVWACHFALYHKHLLTKYHKKWFNPAPFWLLDICTSEALFQPMPQDGSVCREIFTKSFWLHNFSITWNYALKLLNKI